MQLSGSFATVLQANAAWYITLIMCQFWHIWLCKTRRQSIFTYKGLFTNRVTFLGVGIALAIMVIAVYVPWLQARAWRVQVATRHAKAVLCFELCRQLQYQALYMNRIANCDGVCEDVCTEIGSLCQRLQSTSSTKGSSSTRHSDVQDNLFYTANPPGVQAWVPHFFFLVYALIYTETSKFIARKYPNSFFTRYFMW